MYRKIFPYLLLIPTFLVIILFIYWPAAYAFKLSLYKLSPFGTRMVFVGTRNFKILFQNEEYLYSIKFTIIYVSITVFLTVMLSFIIALLLNQNIPGRNVYRTIIFSPYAISPAIAGTLWTFLLNPVVGHVNYFFMKFFGIQVEWLTTKPYALYALIFASVWKMMPFDIIFYLAGLQDIPEDVIEASIIDGANTWKKTWKIIFPLVSPITFYLVIMNIITAMFQSFAIIDVMTKGGPGTYTTSMIYRLFLDGFAFQKTGIASAESVIMFAIMTVVTLIYFFFGERRVHYQ